LGRKTTGSSFSSIQKPTIGGIMETVETTCDECNAEYKIKHDLEPANQGENDRADQLRKLKRGEFKYGDLLMETRNYGNVPFLLFFTDGWDDVPVAFGPLYRDYLGNILYIVTRNMYIGNVRPRNFIYCDIHAENFAEAFDTDGNIIDKGQGHR